MFKNFKDKLTDITKNGIPINISASMLERLIKMKSDEQDIKVKITSEHLILSGTTEIKKLMIKKNIAFSIVLKPVHLEKRTILFEMVEMKPIDMNFINSKIFNKPPFLEYTDRTIKIDFNEWEQVRKVPVGNIKSYELVDGGMNLKISL